MHQTFEAAIGSNLLHANQHLAAHNRANFDAWELICLNLMSGPGAGKTSLLERTLAELVGTLDVAVIEGDMTTQLDAERLRKYGFPVIAINTGRACHLDAKMVAGGLVQLQNYADPKLIDLLLVENVGNLVCPAEFEVGEHAKVALLSITEGEDKPLKYPIMFQAADCVLITKIDLAPYLEIDLERIKSHIQEVNPHVPIIQVSSRSGVGLEDWLDWILYKITSRSQLSTFAQVAC
ncbi:MAG: hydrogenase nickel incorporation protein HypB [Cyanobacteriota bacterium]|nr:hydrogenase nickel incorporation protein HypB [Cyanobacteriota bacterium]